MIALHYSGVRTCFIAYVWFGYSSSITTMENNPHFIRKTHQRLNAQFATNPRNSRGISCSNFLLKFLFIAMFLSIIPLFPSEPPESISHTVFAHTWELFRLLIIGIVLSYGLFFCRRNTRTHLKTQISQPPISNVLQHSSIFDYENENQSGILEKNDDVTTQSCNLSSYRSKPEPEQEQEPYVVRMRKESCKLVDEKPLGLPVRSLRSRIVDSESDEECESDSSCKRSCNNSSSFVNSKKDKFKVDMENFTPISFNSRSVKDNFLAEKGNSEEKIEPKQLKSQSFRLPTQRLGQKNYGFCSWLPDSPNMEQLRERKSMGVENSWTENPNFYVPSTVVTSSSNAVLCDDSASRSMNYIHGNFGGFGQGQSLSSDYMNLGSNKAEFFLSSAADLPSMLPHTSGFDSRFARHDLENVSLGQSQGANNNNYMNTSNAKADFFVPLAGDLPSVLPHTSGFDSRFNPYMNLGNDKPEFFMPSAVDLPSMSPPTTDFASRFTNQSHENVSLGSQGINNNYMNSCNDEPKHFMPSVVAVLPSIVSPPTSDFASRLMKPNLENESLCQLQDTNNNPVISQGSGACKIDSFMPSVAVAPVVSVSDQGFGSSIKPLRPRKLTPERRKIGRPTKLEKGISGGEKTDSFASSAAGMPSVATPEKDCVPSKRSRSRRIVPEKSLEKDEQGTDKDGMGSFVEKNDSCAPLSVVPLLMPVTKQESCPSTDVSSKKDDQRSNLTKWDDDCFVIPSSENNLENVEQEDSLDPSLSAGTSSKRSSNDQASQQVEEKDTSPGSIINSEIEDLGRESDSYKPSTPSPPPQVQARRNDCMSMVDSSFNALDKGSLVSKDGDQGSLPTYEKGKALSKSSQSRRFSCGSFFDRDLRRSFKEEAKETNRQSKGDQYAQGGKCGWDCFSLDVKPALSKTALKGKSVRTIRPQQIPSNTSHKRWFLEEQKDNHVEPKREENEAPLKGSTEGKKGEKPGMVVIQIGISEKRSNSNGRKSDKQGNAGTSIMVGLKTHGNSKGKAPAFVSDVKEDETDNDEIDKKAGEFIAKFKEQMRLQKVGTNLKKPM